jgi:hypothetical protein
MPGSLAIALRYIFGRYNDKLAAEFFERLSTGEGLRRDNPILLLRDKLAENERGRTQEAIAAVTIKAWNGFMAHEKMTPHRLRYRTGKSGEEFPKIAGVEYQVEVQIETEEPSQPPSSDNRELPGVPA